MNELIKVMFHASFREVTGIREIEEKLEKNCTVKSILDKLAKNYGKEFNGIIDPKTNKKLPNIGMGYNVYGDVNRRRVIGKLDGMTGRKGANIISANDRCSIEILSHYMPFMMGVNQTMQLLPYDS